MAIWRPSFLVACLGECGARPRGAEGEVGREGDWKKKVARLVEVSSEYEKEKTEDMLWLLLTRVNNLPI